MWLRVLVSAVFTLLMTAILIRVIGSWLGIGPYRRWMRPIYGLTDWLIDPIRRILPPFGMFDFSPMVAWLVLYVVARIRDGDAMRSKVHSGPMTP